MSETAQPSSDVKSEGESGLLPETEASVEASSAVESENANGVSSVYETLIIEGPEASAVNSVDSGKSGLMDLLDSLKGPSSDSSPEAKSEAGPSESEKAAADDSKPEDSDGKIEESSSEPVRLGTLSDIKLPRIERKRGDLNNSVIADLPDLSSIIAPTQSGHLPDLSSIIKPTHSGKLPALDSLVKPTPSGKLPDLGEFLKSLQGADNVASSSSDKDKSSSDDVSKPLAPESSPASEEPASERSRLGSLSDIKLPSLGRRPSLSDEPSSLAPESSPAPEESAPEPSRLGSLSDIKLPSLGRRPSLSDEPSSLAPESPVSEEPAPEPSRLGSLSDIKLPSLGKGPSLSDEPSPLAPESPVSEEPAPERPRLGSLSDIKLPSLGRRPSLSDESSPLAPESPVPEEPAPERPRLGSLSDIKLPSLGRRPSLSDSEIPGFANDPNFVPQTGEPSSNLGSLGDVRLPSLGKSPSLSDSEIPGFANDPNFVPQTGESSSNLRSLGDARFSSLGKSPSLSDSEIPGFANDPNFVPQASGEAPAERNVSFDQGSGFFEMNPESFGQGSDVSSSGMSSSSSVMPSFGESLNDRARGGSGSFERSGAADRKPFRPSVNSLQPESFSGNTLDSFDAYGDSAPVEGAGSFESMKFDTGKIDKGQSSSSSFGDNHTVGSFESGVPSRRGMTGSLSKRNPESAGRLPDLSNALKPAKSGVLPDLGASLKSIQASKSASKDSDSFNPSVSGGLDAGSGFSGPEPGLPESGFATFDSGSGLQGGGSEANPAWNSYDASAFANAASGSSPFGMSGSQDDSGSMGGGKMAYDGESGEQALDYAGNAAGPYMTMDSSSSSSIDDFSGGEHGQGMSGGRNVADLNSVFRPTRSGRLPDLSSVLKPTQSGRLPDLSSVIKPTQSGRLPDLSSLLKTLKERNSAESSSIADQVRDAVDAGKADPLTGRKLSDTVLIDREDVRDIASRAVYKTKRRSDVDSQDGQRDLLASGTLPQQMFNQNQLINSGNSPKLNQLFSNLMEKTGRLPKLKKKGHVPSSLSLPGKNENEDNHGNGGSF